MTAVPLAVPVFAICVTMGIHPSSFALDTRRENTTLTVPEIPQSFGYQTENAFPGLSFTEPVAVVSRPGDANTLFVVERAGKIYIIPNLASPAKSVFLDISQKVDSSQNEEGLFSLAFHPDWETNGYFYVHYTTSATTADGTGRHGRISRFAIDQGNSNLALPSSEQPLLSQFDQDWNHNGGELKFGPDGYLYASLGDEGGSGDSRNNSRSINKDFFSSILRIDVDKLPASIEPNPHPAVHLDGEGLAYYSIPPDNPFIGATSFNGDPIDPNTVRTEFWAAGLRNPWRFSFDEATGLLYCADVGQNAYEEVNIIEKGGDYGWRLREGFHPYNGNTVPAGVVLEDPILEYPQSSGPTIPGPSGKAEGKSITGGIVYYGNRIAQLESYYIFGDYVSNRIFAFHYDNSTETVDDFRQLTSITNPVSFGTDPTNGDLLIVSLNGTIYRLLYSDTPLTGDPIPSSLSTTGAFSDLLSLTPETGIEPYEINVPFWSDYAIKSRWFSVPDLADTIGFDPSGNWSFPDGTVWIKHFEIELVEGDPLSRRRLETRFLVKNSDGIHGFTYKWNAGETDAFLVEEEGEDEVLTIHDSLGNVVRTQTWRYPSRSECLQCHTSVGGYALGFSTLQLNGDYDYGAGALNQIGALDSVGYFDTSPGDPNLLEELYPESHPSATVEEKARSYLHANCVQCHQPGGPSQGSWDARILTDLSSTGIINGELVNDQGDPNNKVIASGDLTHSMILQRMSTRSSLQMPPIGSNETHADGITIMSNWISSLGSGGASPVLSGSRNAFTYTEGDNETIIDSSIVVSDTDTTDFSGGSLTVTLVGTDGLDDQLSIQDQGSGSGQIGVNGNTVSFEGVPIGTLSGGESPDSPLVVSITGTASASSMTALSQAVSFRNTSSTPLVFDRTVEIQVTDETSLASNTWTYTISINSIPEDPIVDWSDPSAIVYGTALSATQLNASASVPGNFDYSPDIGTILNAGSSHTLQATFTPADIQNYNVVVASADLNVSKALATLSASNEQRLYGSSNPAFTYSASGLVNGDSQTDIDTLPSLSTIANSASPVGSYPIEITGAVDANYDFIYVSGTLSVDSVPLTIQADDKSRLFGQSNPLLTASYSGFVLGEGPTDLDTPPTLSTLASSASPVGNYAINVSGASDSNYLINFISGTLSVSKTTVTLSAVSTERFYGSVNPSFTFTASGLANGESIDNIDVQPTLETSAISSSPPGEYSINLSGASDPNYDFNYAPGILSVEPAPLTVTAEDKNREFGQPNPALTVKYSGFVLGEGPQDLDTSVDVQTNANVESPVADYPITASGATDARYTISYEDGILSVEKATVTMSADDSQKLYGSANPTFNFTTTGLLNGDTINDIDTLPIITTTASSSSPVGNYAITLSGAHDSDYDFVYVAGNLSIDPAPLTVTADNKARTYGELNPPLTATYSGLVLGESPQDLDSPAGLFTSATSASPAGEYAITASGASSPNYSVFYEAGTLTVGKAEATLTAIDAQRNYGSPNPDFSIGTAGLVNGDISLNDLETPPTLSSPATNDSPPGSYAIEISGASDPNYTFNYESGSLLVKPAPLTIRADDKERDFGQPNPELTASYTGFVLGQGPLDLDALPLLHTDTTIESPVGLYEIAVSGASDPNYAITHQSGFLSIGRTLVTLTASDFERKYGDLNPEFTYTASGLMNGETIADISTPPTITTSATQNSNAGSYSINLSGADDPNYFFTYQDGRLDVTPITLVASTTNQSRSYGSANPAILINYNGFVLDDTAADLDTPPVALTEALIDSPVGEYRIEVSGGSDANYLFEYEPAILSVVPTPLVIMADNKARSYGQPNPALTASYSGFALGEGPQNLSTSVSLESIADQNSPVGVYTINAFGASSDNYAITFEPGTLEVRKANATLVARDAQRIYGSENPNFSFIATGLVAGDGIEYIDTPPVLTTIATISSPPGTYDIDISNAIDHNYNFTFAKGTLIIDPALLTIKADNKSKEFGEPTPPLTATFSGFALGDGPEDLDTPVTLATDADTESPNGLYSITVSGAADSNYAITHVDGYLSVGKALATLVAHDKQKIYGDPNPAFTFEAIDLIDSRTIADIDTQPSLTTLAEVDSDVGVFPIFISGAEDSEYFFVYQPAELEILPRTITVTADDKAKTYGEPNPPLTASFEGFSNDDGESDLDTLPQLNTEALENSPVGDYGISVSGASDLNYDFVYQPGTLTIDPAPLTITADDQQRPYGQPNPVFSASYIGLIPGETPESIGAQISLSTSATENSLPGDYPLTISGSAGSNYLVELVDGTLVIKAFVGSVQLTYQREARTSTISFVGVPSTRYVIEGSQDLLSWSELWELTTDETGFGELVFPVDRNEIETLFFRVGLAER